MNRFLKKIATVLTAVGLFAQSLPAVAVNAATTAAQVEANAIVPNAMATNEQAEVTISLTGNPYINKTEPNDVILVIDRSGSMREEIADMIAAAKSFVNSVNLSTHRIGIVAYDDTILTSPITDDKNELTDFLGSITANGLTYTTEAINEAASMLAGKRKEAVGSIVLMTDGVAQNQDTAVLAAESAKALGYYFYTVALCDSETSIANTNLKKMATSEADHYSVFASSQLTQIYNAIADKIGKCNAKDVVITHKIGSEFELVASSIENNIPKPTYDSASQTLTWKMNQLGEGLSTLSYKFTVKSGVDLGAYHTGDGSVTYVDYNDQQQTIDLPGTDVVVRLPAPKITSMSPSGYNGLTEKKISVYGQYFMDGAKLYVDGKEDTNAVITSNYISFIAPVHDHGSIPIKVVNPDNQSASTTLKVSDDPKITSITPNTCEENTSVKTTIKGSDFVGNYKTLSVRIGGSAATITKVSSTSITCTVPALSAGTYDVTVYSADGRTAVYPDGFTYTPGQKEPDPIITSITPNSCNENTSVKAKILGSNIRGNYTNVSVEIGGQKATITSVSSTSVIFYVPALAAGTYDVVLTNSDGTKATVSNGFTYLGGPTEPDPIIKSITPNSCDENTSVKVKILGSNFRGNYTNVSVEIGGQKARITSVSSTSVIFYVPALAAGTYDVVFTNKDGTKATVTNGFTYVGKPKGPDPVIKSITPNSCDENTSVKAKILGSNIRGNYTNVSVEIGGQKARITGVSSTSVIFYVPALAAGTYDVVFTNSDGTKATVTNGFTYVGKPKGPDPVIKSITPNSCDENTSVKAKISGSNIRGNYTNVTVEIGGQKATILGVSSTSIIFNVPALAAGTYDVAVTNSDGTKTTLTNGFTYTGKPAEPDPVITSITPNSCEENSSIKVKLLGSNIRGNYTNVSVEIGGQAATITSVSSTAIICNVPALAAGTYDVVLTNSDGTKTTLANGFTYTSKPTEPDPVISSITPSICEENTSISTKILGSNIRGNYTNVTVEIGGQKATITSVSSTAIICNVPALTLGTYDVVVTNSDGTKATLSNGFTYMEKEPEPTPIVTGITPNSCEENTSVTAKIVGSNFTGNYTNVKVEIGGQAATVTSVSSTAVAFTVPALAAGTYDVVFTNGDGTALTISGGFTYKAKIKLDPPVINGITPESCSANSSVKVKITGVNFRGNYQTMTVTIGGEKVTINKVSSTFIIFYVPALAAGTYEVVVINDDGTQATYQFTYV
ncbi:MAG: IPT/TIG domain-containing protein [Oscillospiraceae bacterium]